MYANLEKQITRNSNSSTLREERRKEAREEGGRRRQMGGGSFLQASPRGVVTYAVPSAAPQTEAVVFLVFPETTLPSKKALAGACAGGYCYYLCSRGALWCSGRATTGSLGSTGNWSLASEQKDHHLVLVKPGPH